MFEHETSVRVTERPALVKRKAVRVSQQELVNFGSLATGVAWPHVIRPNIVGVNPAAWVKSRREEVESLLLLHGAILFRDFAVNSVAAFEQFLKAISPELLDYRERAAPRRAVGENVYTSTEFPADQFIPLHHEMSYSHNWPTKIMFYCAQPAQLGGSTPIADDRKVFGLIDPEIKRRFLEQGVMYVRNYGQGVDLSWQDAFQTNDRAVVEDYFRRSHTRFEWHDGDRLRTRQVRQAVVVHPKVRETVWFNHAHMFHHSNLSPAVRDSLLSTFAEDELPRNAFYGDGSPIESSVLDEIRSVYRGASVAFEWKRGDVLLLDNFLTSHGREPFVGTRSVLVGMAERFVNQEFAS